MGVVFFRGGESLDLRSGQQLGEDEGIWCGGSSCDEIGSGAGRGGRFRKCKERLEMDQYIETV